MDATCYAVRGKAKSEALCSVFASGVRACGGTAQVIIHRPHTLLPGAAVFYGVRPQQKWLLEQAKLQRRDWYYIDNAYFDSTREHYFRITKNRLQHNGMGDSDGRRFISLGIDIEPWRKSGAHVLVCPQSDEFAELFFEDGAAWTDVTLEELKKRTQREVRVRPWQANKLEWYRTLPADLADCWALVTHSSASAITAMLNGVAAFVTGHDCISRPVANLSLAHIETPHYSPNLRAWCNVVADNQFSIKEIESGYAWHSLNDPARLLNDPDRRL